MAEIKQDAGFWTRLWQRMRGKNRLDEGEKTQSFSSATSSSGSVVTVDKSMKLSAVWACVRLKSQTIGSLPLHLKENFDFAKDHHLYSILHDAPNSDVIASKFWEAVVTNIDLWGNAYIKIGRYKDEVASLTLLNPEKMEVAREGGKLSYKYDSKEMKSDDVMHIRGLTLDGYIGLSAIEYFAETIGFQDAANSAANTEFKNGMKAGGFIDSGQQTLSDEQRIKLRNWLGEFSRPENSGKWMVLEAGMKPVSTSGISIKPSDAQLLESRHFGIEEICRAFGVPPTLIGHTDKASSWASSLEQTNLGFLTYSLTPILVSIEQEIKRCLLSPTDRKKYSAKFSVEGLLRADSAGRSAFYTAGVNNGYLTRNEVRALEDRPPIAGGDTLTVQMQMQDIDKRESNEQEDA